MIAPWRVFAVEVSNLVRLSPSFLRVTFTGDDLNTFADNGYDQRFKLVLPHPGDFPSGPDWYTQWRAMPADNRHPIRTYTVRAVRQQLREVDVDIALHADGGPAGRWAEAAQIGDKLAFVGPDARHEGSHGGIEWQPPAGARTVLLAGDETAVPAICSILERLPAHLRGDVIMEVPSAEDFLSITAPPAMTVTWRTRNDSLPSGSYDYAWIAGEASMVQTLRRHLLQSGMEKQSVTFMGYWRLGRAEEN